MTFNNLHKDINFNCILDDVHENIKDRFIRKVLKDIVTIDDFKSYWEEGDKSGDDHKKRKKKGVSINKIVRDNEELIRSNFKTTEALKPIMKKRYSYYCIVQFNKGAGKLWDYATLSNNFHCTFYKSDLFCLDLLTIIDVKEI